MIRRIRMAISLIAVIIVAGYYLTIFMQDRKTLNFEILDQFTVSTPGYWEIDEDVDSEDADLALLTREEDVSVHFVILSKEETEYEDLESFAEFVAEATKESDPEYELKPVDLESYEKAFYYTGSELLAGSFYAINEYLVEKDGYYIFGTALSVESNSKKADSEVKKMLISLKPAE
ncbi:MAG: hypothetical protein Q4A19_01550 [Johnsonella sp.]|nr:hypothetical protein [Johnsonella sp.]